MLSCRQWFFFMCWKWQIPLQSQITPLSADTDLETVFMMWLGMSVKQYEWAILCCQVWCQNNFFLWVKLTSCPWSIHTSQPCCNTDVEQKLEKSSVFAKKKDVFFPWSVEYETLTSNTWWFTSTPVYFSFLNTNDFSLFAAEKMQDTSVDDSLFKVKPSCEVPPPSELH